MATLLTILMVIGIYIVIPAIVAFAIIGAVVLRQRVRKATEVSKAEKEAIEVGKWAPHAR